MLHLFASIYLSKLMSPVVCRCWLRTLFLHFVQFTALVAQVVVALGGGMIMDDEFEESWRKPRQTRLRYVYLASESVFEAGTSRMRNGEGNRYTATFEQWRRCLIFSRSSSPLEFASCVFQANFFNTGFQYERQSKSSFMLKSSSFIQLIL
jgi:hypothetical protein